jgi:hypothetical protein
MLAKSPRNLLIGTLLISILPLMPAQASQVSLSFSGQGTGPLLLVPESDTLLSETIDLAYRPISGFGFDRLFISDWVDLTATDLEDMLFDRYFELTAVDGSGLYGTFDLISSEYPIAGQEILTGTFHADRGSGVLAGYTAFGTFSAENLYFNDLEATSTMQITGLASIPEPTTLLLLGIGATSLVTLGRRRYRTKSGGLSGAHSGVMN